MKSKRRVCIHVSDAMRGEGVKTTGTISAGFLKYLLGQEPSKFKRIYQ